MSEADENKMHLNIKGQDGRIVRVKTRKAAALKEVMEAYCVREGLEMNKICFRIDGNRVCETQTPAELNMHAEDMLEVHYEKAEQEREPLDATMLSLLRSCTEQRRAKYAEDGPNSEHHLDKVDQWNGQTRPGLDSLLSSWCVLPVNGGMATQAFESNEAISLAVAAQRRPAVVLRPTATNDDFLLFMLKSFRDPQRLTKLQQKFKKAGSTKGRVFFVEWVQKMRQCRELGSFNEKITMRCAKQVLLSWHHCARRDAIARIDFEIDSMLLQGNSTDTTLSPREATTHELRMQSLLEALRKSRVAEREISMRVTEQERVHDAFVVTLREQISQLQAKLKHTKDKLVLTTEELKSQNDTIESLCTMYLYKEEQLTKFLSNIHMDDTTNGAASPTEDSANESQSNFSNALLNPTNSFDSCLPLKTPTNEYENLSLSQIQVLRELAKQHKQSWDFENKTIDPPRLLESRLKSTVTVASSPGPNSDNCQQVSGFPWRGNGGAAEEEPAERHLTDTDYPQNISPRRSGGLDGGCVYPAFLAGIGGGRESRHSDLPAPPRASSPFLPLFQLNAPAHGESLYNARHVRDGSLCEQSPSPPRLYPPRGTLGKNILVPEEQRVGESEKGSGRGSGAPVAGTRSSPRTCKDSPAMPPTDSSTKDKEKGREHILVKATKASRLRSAKNAAWLEGEGKVAHDYDRRLRLLAKQIALDFQRGSNKIGSAKRKQAGAQQKQAVFRV